MECNLTHFFRFILEVDGVQHFTVRENSLFDFTSQNKRDRYVEAWGVAQGYSVFRVPDTLKSTEKRRTAMEYCIRAAKHDFTHSTPRVHYLDFKNTYAKINTEAAKNDAIDTINTTAVPGQEALGVHVSVTHATV
eukprot:3932267-Rhodomonas_salina.1